MKKKDHEVDLERYALIGIKVVPATLKQRMYLYDLSVRAGVSPIGIHLMSFIEAHKKIQKFERKLGLKQYQANDGTDMCLLKDEHLEGV